MKTIYLVTGAAGFMGTNVCAQLLERGDAVRAFVLKGDPAVKFVPKAVEIFEGDLCSAEDCEKFFAVEPGTQTVCIHCASMVTINPNYSEKLIAVNVGGIENMLNAAKKGFINATDVADYLTQKGEPFRSAYKISGQLVAYCIAHGKVLEDLDIEVYRNFSKLFDESIYGAIDLSVCVEKRMSEGGTSTLSVRKQIADMREFLKL